jgi:DNA-binding MarR family transcriptional regulator
MSGGTPGNSGGKKGRSGRPPKAFKNFLAQMRQDPTVQRQFELTIKERGHRHWPAALKVLTDYDDELPANLTPEERAQRILAIMKVAEDRAKAAGQT